MLFSKQDKILDILVTTILILYRKPYINIVSIIVLNIEARQCNIKINLAISCSPSSFVALVALSVAVNAKKLRPSAPSVHLPARPCECIIIIERVLLFSRTPGQKTCGFFYSVRSKAREVFRRSRRPISIRVCTG